MRPRLVEHEHERARELAEDLSGTTVSESDATDRVFLETEHINAVDIVITALDSDEKNLLAGLLAKRLGAERAFAVVDSGEYVDLFKKGGIDVAINLRQTNAEEITRFTRELQAEKVAIIEFYLAEILENKIDAESVLTGRPIRESIVDLEGAVIIGAITRNGEFIIPRGDTVIEPGNHVIVFVDIEYLDEVNAKL